MIIRILPEDSLVHEDVSIRVFNMMPNTIVKIELRLMHLVGTYRSFAVFKANPLGSIDLETDSPIRGTYSGVRKMGLFESVEPTDSVRYGAYCKCSPPVDFQYQLIVKDSTGEEVCSKRFIKRLIHPDVQRIDIEPFTPHVDIAKHKRPKVTGTLFKPPGKGPFPTIIDISGTGGGINEQKGAAMASRGFCVFSLAYFQYKSLPENLHEVDVRYFEDAINLLTSLPFTEEKIGIQGISFGGTLTLLIASMFPQIKAVVAINGSFMMDEIARIIDDGKDLPYANIDIDKAVYFLNGLLCYNKIGQNLVIPKDADFKLENTGPDTAFRFVSALDDLSTATVHTTNLLTARLKKLKRPVEVHFLPGGHLMEPPCWPSHPTVYSKIPDCHQAYGGEASLHGKSEFQAWESTIQFFSKYIGKPTPLRKYHESTSKL